MNRLLLCLLSALCFGVGSAYSQASLHGIVRDMESGNPLPGVLVQLVGSSAGVETDARGEYSMSGLKPGSYMLGFSLTGYQYYEAHIQLVDGTIDLPEVQLRRSQADDSHYLTFSEVTVSSDELDDEAKAQPVSGLLQSSQDAFVAAVAYTFSPARFQIRGYDSDYSLVYMNGVPVNDPESGFASWSSWGGLNDVTRNREARNGLSPTDFSFGALGGATNINTRASLARAGTKVSYAATNRTYTNRLMVTHSTGLKENGVAFTLSGSRRWAKEGYVEGTSYDAWAYFISIEKRFSAQHQVAFTTFNAPTRRGMQGAAVDEMNALAGTNYYNPNWGYQNGEKRNARIRNQQEPAFILNHFWDITEGLKLTTTAGYSIGTFSTTSLNWYNAQDPRPDYYRKLPSYRYESDPDVADQIAEAFRTDASVRQINWDEIYQTNYRAADTAVYFLENRITDSKQFSFSSVLNWNASPGVKINGGVEMSVYKGKNYKTMYDLLGAQYFIDIDQFAERDFNDDNTKQNDLDNPNRLVKKDDVFGYNYLANVNNGGAWAVAKYTASRFELYLGGNLTATQFWRTGNMRNGRFPNYSKGDSEKNRFVNHGVKAGGTWKLTGRHYLEANLAYLTRPPFFRNSYISPRTSNYTITGLTDERIASADINYNIRTPFLKARLSAYYTKFMDQTELKSFFYDTENTFINYTMRGIDKVHRGFELGAEIRVTPTISVSTAAALGAYQYTSRPNVTITLDNSGSLLAERVVYIENFYIPSTPQTAAMIGLKYASPKYWFINLDLSYFDDIYIDFAPERRTSEGLMGLEPNDPFRQEVIRQTRVPSAYLLDASIGKSWRVEGGFLNLNLQVANVLDNQNFKTGGYEQLRSVATAESMRQFPPRYYYAYGRTFYLILGFRF